MQKLPRGPLGAERRRDRTKKNREGCWQTGAGRELLVLVPWFQRHHRRVATRKRLSPSFRGDKPERPKLGVASR